MIPNPLRRIADITNKIKLSISWIALSATDNIEKPINAEIIDNDNIIYFIILQINY